MKRALGLIGGIAAVASLCVAVAAAQPPAAPTTAPTAGAAPAPGRGGPGRGAAPAGPNGPALFQAHCAGCHDPSTSERIPSRMSLAQNFPEAIMTAMTTGPMKPMAEGLSQPEMEAIAQTVTGRAPKPVGDIAEEGANACPKSDHFNAAGPSWNGWSPTLQNTRLQANPGLKAADVPRLKVKWAFKIGGSRFGQPTPVGNRVFATSSSGRVYSLDRANGCVDWSFTAPAGVRTTVSVSRNASAPSGWAVYFGDYFRQVYALDARSGAQLWKRTVEDHPRGMLSGAPVAYNGVLYVPASSWEETVGGIDAYQCCTFRGSLSALNIRDGKVLWKTYMIEDTPHPYRKNPAGTQMYGPAGAAIWSSPTLDTKRGLIYVATGDSYTDVPQTSSDSVIALDLKTGAIRWKNQVTAEDNFMTGCQAGRAGCPLKVGPDFDFGSSPILATVGGRDVVVAGQKSATVYGMDPDTGHLLWKTKVGGGGALGGIEWGMAADGDTVYAANADAARGAGNPGLTALNILTGDQRWQIKAAAPKCGWEGACKNGYSAPPSMIPGIVFSGSQDGHLRAFDTRNGGLVWDFDTAGQKYDTVNGVKGQRGGQLDGSGPAIAGGMLFMMSGYNGSGGGGWADNVLLAFSVDGK